MAHLSLAKLLLYGCGFRVRVYGLGQNIANFSLVKLLLHLGAWWCVSACWRYLPGEGPFQGPVCVRARRSRRTSPAASSNTMRRAIRQVRVYRVQVIYLGTHTHTHTHTHKL